MIKDMKKNLFLMFALLACFLSASATDEVVATDVSLPQGGTGTVDIELNNDQEFTAFQMQLTLPEGVSFVTNKKGNPTFEKGDRYDDHSLSSSALGVFTCISFSLTPFDDTEGLLLSINVAADANTEVGKPLKAKLSNIEFTTIEGKRVQFDDVDINIAIGEPISTDIDVLLDGTDVQSDEWYTTDGRKLPGKPSEKGVYINNGKTVYVK